MTRKYKGNPYASAEYKKNRLEILEAANYTCHYCNGPANTADHIVPVSKGGGHQKDNLLPCCTKCNSSRQAKTLKRMPYWNRKYV